MAKMIDPWGKDEIKDYDKIVKDLGLGRFEKFVPKLKELPLFMKRGLVYGERDFNKVYDAIKGKKKFAMLTGLMPSGKFHFGHMMLAREMIFYQKMGADCYIVVADIESYLTRGMPLEKAREIAIEEYILNYIALGLKPKNCKIYFQSGCTPDYYKLSKMISRYTTLNEMKDIYGELDTGKIVSVFTQIADILYPQLKENGGAKATIVPVGFDQLPHINLCRDIASKLKEFKFILPSATFHKFVPGLKGGKMSSSDPSSYIALSDSPKIAEEKIKKHAFSGGRVSLKEHREKGGNPDIDISFQYLRLFFEKDDKKLKKLYDEYKGGKLLTGELKNILIEKMGKFLEEHQKRREKARKELDKFLK
ncbi:MAG: tryptophan--tRNA ligase [Candidatus Aenigmarchaeota archaeon]|nr:tryptophan--tRNA ligase [Candidatus Aenigmarchaeota archaeon]